MSQTQEMRAPYLKFERQPREDRSKQVEGGKYAFMDVDMVHITVPGQRDTVTREAISWLKDVERQAENKRVPANWPAAFRAQYDAWKNGQDIPLEGTPIAGWQLLTPAQQRTVTEAGIRTVEDLAAASDEAVRAIGMGGAGYKTKAVAWLLEATDKGKLAEENATLRRDLEATKTQLDQLIKDVAEMKKGK